MYVLRIYERSTNETLYIMYVVCMYVCMYVCTQVRFLHSEIVRHSKEPT